MPVAISVFTIFLIRITVTANSNIVHARYSHDGRLILRQIKLFIFFFKSKAIAFLSPCHNIFHSQLLWRLYIRQKSNLSTQPTKNLSCPLNLVKNPSCLLDLAKKYSCLLADNHREIIVTLPCLYFIMPVNPWKRETP